MIKQFAEDCMCCQLLLFSHIVLTHVRESHVTSKDKFVKLKCNATNLLCLDLWPSWFNDLQKIEIVVPSYGATKPTIVEQKWDFISTDVIW